MDDRVRQAIDALARTYEARARDAKVYDGRRAYRRCAADLRFLLTEHGPDAILALDREKRRG